MKYKIPQSVVVLGTVLSIDGPLDFTIRGEHGYVFKCVSLRDWGLYIGDEVSLLAEMDSTGETIVLHVSEVFSVNEKIL